jgi:membrane fusion protein, multidrug efflux system
LVELDSSVERAQLRSVKARERLAESTTARTANLVRAGALAPAELESAQTTLESLRADAKMLEAQIARKTVRAPFSGTVGLRQINLGQYLAPGTPIAVLESEQPATLDFTLPQQALPRLSVGMPVRAAEEISGRALAEGSIIAVEPSLDPVTRTVRVRASLRDEKGQIRPGMYLRAEVVLAATDSVVAIPATAVLRAPYGDSVFLVEPLTQPGGQLRRGVDAKPHMRARQQFVRLGATRGDFTAVLEGVSAGQVIVTQGAFKLRNGTTILVDNQVTITPELLPHPQNG